MSTGGVREGAMAEARTASETETTDARPRAEPIDPGLHGRQRRLELEAEPSEDHDARCERRVGQRELASDEELLTVQLVAQEIQRATELVAGLVDALPVPLGVGLANLC